MAVDAGDVACQHRPDRARGRGRRRRPAPHPSAPALAAGVALDFSDSEVLDCYGAIGWGRTDDRGATTRGGEARLVLPLAEELDGHDLELTLEWEALGSDVDLAVLANETEVATARVTGSGTRLTVRVPAPTAQRFRPLELSLRSRRRLPPEAVRLRLRAVALSVPRGE